MTQKLLFCVLSWPTGVSGPYFFDMTDMRCPRISVISKHYTVVINEFLAPEIPPNNKFCFQQDGVMAHTAMIRTATFRTLESSTDDLTFR